MRHSMKLVIAVVGTLLVTAGPVLADTGGGTDHMDGLDHSDNDDYNLLFGPWPFFAMGFVVYWIIAIPIGLLVYTDAQERRLNGKVWLLIIMVPWMGLLAVLAYHMARQGYPRVDVHDPYVEGDLLHDSMLANQE